MKTSIGSFWLLFAQLWLTAPKTLGQGTFQNLDFEATLIQQTQAPGFVSVADAFPGWSVFYGTNQQSLVLYNDAGIGSTVVDLLGTNPPRVGYKSIEDGFSALLQGGVSGSAVLFPTAASIRQTGTIPVFARSILFKAQHDASGILSMSLGGVSVPYFALSNGPDYVLYGGDVSSFAGQILALEFSVSRLPDRDYSNWNIDSIEFSASTVPEPGVLGLSAMGVLMLGWSVFRKRR